MNKNEIINLIEKHHKRYQDDFKVTMSEYNLGKVGAIQNLIRDIEKSEIYKKKKYLETNIIVIKNKQDEYLLDSNKKKRRTYSSYKNAHIALVNYCSSNNKDYFDYRLEEKPRHEKDN